MIKPCHKLRLLIGIYISLLFANTCFAGGNYTLTLEQWSLPKKVESILKMQAIKSTLADFEKSPDSQLRVLYPGGDEGTLWAHELKAWLVSLGISSRQIELQPGSRDSNVIEMRVDSPIFDMMKSK